MSDEQEHDGDRWRSAPGGPGRPAAIERRELVEAMRQIAATGQGPAEQIACIGCSIKWRNG